MTATVVRPPSTSITLPCTNAASSLAKMLGSAELAGIAADRAVRAAALTGDPLLNAAAAYRLANVLLAAGQPEPAQAVAIRAADQLRPVLTASPSHTATWGALIATSALAATQTAADADARELLGAAVGSHAPSFLRIAMNVNPGIICAHRHDRQVDGL